MLRVAFICQQNPWKLNGGALIRNYWLVRALAERFRVDLITAGDEREEVPAEFAAACASIARFPRPSGAASRRSRVAGMLRPRGSYFTSGSVTPALRHAVRKLTASGGYAAMTDLQMRDALPAGLPFVYNAHNAEYELLRRRAAIEESLAARAFVAVEARRIEPLERRFLRDATLVAACSAADREDLVRLWPAAAAKIAIVPNGVDVARFAPISVAPGEPGVILLTGSFDWRPNRVGLDWFMQRVLPALRRERAAGSFSVRVAGRMDAALAASLDALPNVRAVPNPRDMAAELGKASLVAAAILASSGTRLRILEAWAAGRPVVTTTAGAFGLDCRAGVELLVADEAEAFARTITSVLDDRERAGRLRAAALERVRQYAWPHIAERFLAESEPFFARMGDI